MSVTVRNVFRQSGDEFRAALKAEVLTSDLSPQELRTRLKKQYERWWSIDIDHFASKEHFLRYAGRYVRRPPIAQYRFTRITDREIRFWARDKIQNGHFRGGGILE